MNTDRRAILSLIAMGRITPREAERLLTVWSDRDEVTLWLAVLLAIVWLLLPHTNEIFAGLASVLDIMGPRYLACWHHAASMVSGLFGGRL